MSYTRFEQIFFNYFEQFKRLQEASPLVLGGISGAGGGVGGRPGGFVGVLPQTDVAFDLTEDESLTIPYSGASLVDNLNRIRYRIGQLEDFSVNEFIELIDTPSTYSGEANKYLSVKGDETGVEFITIVPSGNNFKTKVSSNDTTEDFLENKIIEGAGITITTLYDGSDEDLEISNTFETKVSSDDTTENYLENKILGGSGITVVTISGGSNEHLEIIASGIPWNNINNRPYRVITFGYQGELSVKTLEARLHSPLTGTIANITATVNTAPVGESIILDVLKNGSTIFTTSSNRPTIAAGTQNDLSSIPDITSVSLDDLFTVEIIQVGSSTPGSDLVLQIRCEV